MWHVGRLGVWVQRLLKVLREVDLDRASRLQRVRNDERSEMNDWILHDPNPDSRSAG